MASRYAMQDEERGRSGKRPQLMKRSATQRSVPIRFAVLHVEEEKGCFTPCVSYLDDDDDWIHCWSVRAFDRSEANSVLPINVRCPVVVTQDENMNRVIDQQILDYEEAYGEWGELLCGPFGSSLHAC